MMGFLGLSAIGMTGCTIGSGAYSSLTDCDCIDDFMLGYRNRAMAEKAWHCRKPCIPNRQYTKEFKDGFIAGYMDIAAGGNGCTPAMAPSSFWGFQYQTASGHQAINAWFAGFPQGVKAAEQDGVGHWHSIGMSRYQRPAPLPAAYAPVAVPEDGEPEVSNPFYSDQEMIPTPDPETAEEWEDSGIEFQEIMPGNIDQMEIPASPDEADSVFDGLFPPVSVEDTDFSATSPDEVIAEGSLSDADDESLPFSFE